MEENINIEIINANLSLFLNENKKILKYEKFDVSISIAKHKIKDEIRKSSIPLNIKSKRMFNDVSQEIGFICP
ncbi:hypothetical protein H8356DRAFT_1354368 [Neocallimastix lanati (nom. inval.)]|nr:hypothetical protein H8356DRAFT_1354368 [Neocallimastix sp. JGI-2020a]